MNFKGKIIFFYYKTSLYLKLVNKNIYPTFNQLITIFDTLDFE